MPPTAVTSRGFGTGEMQRVAGWITEVIEAIDDDAVAGRVRSEVAEMCEGFPVPGAAFD